MSAVASDSGSVWIRSRLLMAEARSQELLQWWLDTFSNGSTYHRGNESTLNKHLFRSELAPLPLIAVTPERIEMFLLKKGREALAPQTLNHLRGYLSRAFRAYFGRNYRMS